MKTGTKTLAEKLLSHIYTAPTLKDVSICLEELAQNRHFKSHASGIVNDPSLSPAQKTSQLAYLFQHVENTLVYNFFTDLVGVEEWWLFDREKIDYFDEFVQEFQLSIEEIQILHMTTAVKLSEPQLKNIARDLTHDMGKKVVLSYQVNPSLIGGIQIKIGNYIYDYSLRSKFQQFQREWLATLDKHAKLTGRYDPTITSEE